MHAIIDADTAASFLDYVKPIDDEFKLQLNGGWEATICDPANVAMTSVTLPADAFESFEASDDGVLGINRERLDDMLGLSDDVVDISLNESTGKLEIESAGLDVSMALIEPSAIRQEPDIPDLDEQWTADVVLEARDLQDAITAAELVSDHATFSADPDAGEFIVSAEGDTDTVRWAFDREDLIDGTIDAGPESLFSLDYLSGIVGAFDADVEVRVRFGQDIPVMFEAETSAGDVEYLLAPRITSDGGGR